MEITREPIAVVGAFFVAAGILLYVFGHTRSPGVAVGFGSLYAVAGVVLIVSSLRRRPSP